MVCEAVSAAMLPRGLRNQNPGNIRKSAVAWRGKIKGSDSAFETFEHPVYGIRAMARILMGYQERHGLKTIAQMIGRWAPPNENDTAAYAEAVARDCGVDKDAPYDLSNDNEFQLLLHAMIKVENGTVPYSFQTIREGIALARLKT